MKRLTWIPFFVAATAISTFALAQEPAGRSFGRGGQVALSAERLFGITHTTSSQDSRSFTTVSLFGGSGYSLGFSPYSIPRLAIDGFVSDGLSLGVGASYATVSRSGASNSVTVLTFNPRLGYAIEASRSFTFWPRAGISYVSMDSGSSAHVMAATFEAQFVITAQHFGFMFGPIADVGIDGTRSQKVTQLGVEAGLIGWF